jgi:hypothetical protein
MVTLRTQVILTLRLDGIWSITEVIVALVHDINGLLRPLGGRSPQRERHQDYPLYTQVWNWSRDTQLHKHFTLTTAMARVRRALTTLPP